MPPQKPKSPQADAFAAAQPESGEDFETSMQQLESIVAQMEGGELPLEDALQLFERGMVLSDHCRKSLERAELRLKTLIEASGEDRE